MFMFGMRCVRCDHEIIAPHKTEFLDDRVIRHLWHCPCCKAVFESFPRFPKNANAVCGLPRVREALTVLGLAVLVSGTLGALIYLGADAFMGVPFFVIAITRECITSNTKTVGLPLSAGPT